jgi:transposase
MVATRRAWYGVDAGDKEAVLEAVRKAKTCCKLEPHAKVHSCYEAGRDGWRLHRRLIEQDIDNIVVDSSGIEVNRRARRAKTDRLDGFKLLGDAAALPQRRARVLGTA